MSTLRNILAIIALIASVFTAGAKPKTVKRDSITIFGYVYCEGKPMADVAVSDGFHIVKTDSLGRYNMASHKWQNVVFITPPSGYEPKCNKRIFPKFWALLRKKREVAEQHDFHLVKRDQSNHRMIFMSNICLQNSNDDLMQLKGRTIPMARAIAEEVGDSTAVYTILIGDLSHNDTWYSREFDVDDAVSLFGSLRYPTMLYTVMGDRDHDGAIPGTGLTDYQSERTYVMSCGPKYYSINIGDVHYVVLDNTVFRNEPGKGKYPPEIKGKRNFDRFVTSDQLDWLRKDLALIKDKNTPIVVCMHQTAITTNQRNRISKRFSKPEYVDSLTNCFTAFKRVHFMTSGNMDRRVFYPKELPNIIEHSLASTSGDRWRLGQNGFLSINNVGVPAGVELFDVHKDSIAWHYRTERNESKTFRVYDMSEVGKYYRENTDIQNLLREYPKTFINYGLKDFEKYVYINWWGQEKGASLKVYEDNRSLRVRSIYQADPLYVTTSPTTSLKWSRGRKPHFSRNNCQHLFRVERSSLTSTIKVVAEDPYGRVVEEIFVGKKPFSPTAATK